MYKTLLCTGFHRSATSATAHYLHKAGLNMGYELMGGNISNPNGHYEDWPAVRLHDQQLANNDTNWQYHQQTPLHTDKGFLNDYIAKRNQHDQHWGIKDPRACLFLNDWQQSLGEHGHYLFIARHWSSCIESLLHRHSREFAHQLPTLTPEHVTLQFWSTPELAANMWIAYNRRLIDFAQQHPKQTLIVTQRALFNGVPIITRINEKFGFDLDDNADSPYKPELFNDRASTQIKASLSKSLIAKLDALWQQLLTLADATHSDEKPIEYTPTELPDSLWAQYEQALIKQHQNQPSSEPNYPTTPQALTYPDQQNAETLNEWLKTLPLPIATDENLKQITLYLDQHQPTNGNTWIELGKLALRAKQFTQSISAFKNAIALGSYAPFVSLHLGQAYQQLNDITKANYFYRKAIKDNPKNPQFYVSLAQCLVSQHHTQQAFQCLEDGIEHLGYLPPLVIKYADLLLSDNHLEKAQQILDQCTKPEHPIVIQLNTRLELQKDYQSGVKHYKDSVREKVQQADKITWLAQTGSLLGHASAEQDLLVRCWQHWQAL
ncbi:MULTISPECIES: tetratricopeptide repeat protein [unclassified Vibrio]|uniref:Tetratricopeptide repeat protein n=1 Tax=Vibrio sp. HB236076 TaxID=3232307 RepID=A0AB39HFH5_9VIBR|nr:tetratricopeptide repeat protein [Vibrio sp. HB161653]MDP5254334.1 hypothetical protein [Vibrio sp. HB161653]